MGSVDNVEKLSLQVRSYCDQVTTSKSYDILNENLVIDYNGTGVATGDTAKVLTLAQAMYADSRRQIDSVKVVGTSGDLYLGVNN